MIRAADLAASLLLKIAALVIDGLQPTTTIGIAGCPGRDVVNGETLLKLADAALYAAKQGGRNQVRSAPATA